MDVGRLLATYLQLPPRIRVHSLSIEAAGTLEATFFVPSLDSWGRWVDARVGDTVQTVVNHANPTTIYSTIQLEPCNAHVESCSSCELGARNESGRIPRQNITAVVLARDPPSRLFSQSFVVFVTDFQPPFRPRRTCLTSL